MRNKIVFLGLALILPVLIFVFLKFFGKNEFAVEALFQNGAIKSIQGCAPVNVPYHIPDSVYAYLKHGHEMDSLSILFLPALSPNLKASEAQLTRLDEFIQGTGSVAIKELMDSTDIIKCALVIEKPLDLVLIDGEKRIRGQYESTDRDDVDRLMTELDIILKRY